MDGGAWKAAVHGVAEGWIRLSNFTFTFHFPALEKETATHSSVLAWRIPGTGEPGGLLSMGSHRVRHDWSDLAAVAKLSIWIPSMMVNSLPVRQLTSFLFFYFFFHFIFRQHKLLATSNNSDLNKITKNYSSLFFCGHPSYLHWS